MENYTEKLTDISRQMYHIEKVLYRTTDKEQLIEVKNTVITKRALLIEIHNSITKMTSCDSILINNCAERINDILSDLDKRIGG